MLAINPIGFKNFGKLIGNAVIMSINLDMIVDIYGSLLPFGVFIGMEGKRFHRRFPVITQYSVLL